MSPPPSPARGSILPVLVLVASLGALAGGCASHRAYAVGDLPGEEAARAASSRGVAIAGYTTVDGVHHPLRGTVRELGDSLEFHRPARPARRLEAEIPEARFRLARADVEALDVVDPTAQGIALLGVTVLFAALAGIGMAASAFNDDPLL